MLTVPDLHLLDSAGGLRPAPPLKLRLAANNPDGAYEPHLSAPRPLFFLVSPASLEGPSEFGAPPPVASMHCCCPSALTPADASNLAAPRRSYRPSRNGQEEVTQSQPASLYLHFAAKQILTPACPLTYFLIPHPFSPSRFFSYHLFSNLQGLLLHPPSQPMSLLPTAPRK